MNISLNNALPNKENNSKNEEFELERFNPNNNKNLNILLENFREELIDTLDNENLRSILKEKCRQIKEEQEKYDELKAIISVQKKEIEKNNKLIMELKEDITIWREKGKINKTSEISKLKINKSSNYFISKNIKEEDLQINNFQDSEILEKQFSGDSDVSYSSKIEDNKISKKWFSYEKNITADFDDLEIKLKKNNEKMKYMQQQELKFIDVEISNLSDSKLLINKLELDSTESKMFFNLQF